MRRRRKRGTKKGKRSRDGASRSRSEAKLGGELRVGGNRISIGERPASARLLNAEQSSAVLEDLARAKVQLAQAEEEKAALRHQLEQAGQAVVRAELLQQRVESTTAELVQLRAENTSQTAQIKKVKEEHACAMRCLQKFAVNNRLLGQMMEATEAELQAVTAAAAAVDASDNSSYSSEEGDDEEAGEGEGQGDIGLLEALLSRLEDAELLSRTFLLRPNHVPSGVSLDSFTT